MHDGGEAGVVTQQAVDALDRRMVTKKDAARRQIDVAIRLFHEKEYESTMTLAGAAEGQIDGDGTAAAELSLFAVMKKKQPSDFKTESQWATSLNETLYWLKHPTPQLGDLRVMAEFEAWVMLVRAISKYYSVFLEETEHMNAFVEWGRERGLVAKA
jgi:hypothetical protein